MHSNNVEEDHPLNANPHDPQTTRWHAFRPVPAAQTVGTFEASRDDAIEDTVPLPAYRPERLW